MSKVSDIEVYLRPENIPADGLLVQIIGISLISADDSKFKVPKGEIMVKLPNDTTKIWSANMTSLRNIAQSYGDETTEWHNKYVLLKVEQRQVRNNLVLVTFGYPVPSPPLTEQ